MTSTKNAKYAILSFLLNLQFKFWAENLVMYLAIFSAIQGRISTAIAAINKTVTTKNQVLKKIGAILVLSTLISSMIGCGSVSPSFLTSHHNIRPHSLTPFELTHAYIGDDQLYIQYLERGRLHHKLATFEQIVYVNNEPVNQSFSEITRRKWKASLPVGKTVKILSEEHWVNFKGQLENQYFNQQRFFRHTNLKTESVTNKPLGLNSSYQKTQLENFYDYSEVAYDAGTLKSDNWNRFSDLIFSELDTYFVNNNISEKKVLFYAGLENASAVSLVFFDVDKKEVKFFSLAPNPDLIRPNLMKRSFFTDSGVTIGQLSKSMALDMLLRPVSSLQRLTFLLADTSLDNLQRTALTTVNFPSLSQEPIPDISDTKGRYANVVSGDEKLGTDNPHWMDIEAWEKRLDKITGKKASQGRIKYLIDGKEFFSRFIESISEAEKRVYLHFYIFDSDDYAVKIADLLREKSKDVKVKVLYDGSGSLVASWGSSVSEPVNYQAPITIGKYLSHDSKVRYRVQGTPWLASDHTKTAIIDSNLAFVGGMNIGREYRYEWHDLMMEVRGPIVSTIRREFDKTWAHQGWFGDLGYLAALLKPMQKKSEAELNGSEQERNYPIRILKTTPSNSEIYNTQLAAIRNAKQRIYIQNSYLTDDVIIYELAKARRRGVDVRVIMSLDTDAGAISRSNLLSANTLIENGIRVYVYPKMTHVKAAIYDGWACLGSANFDHLSLRVNKEMNLATSDPEAVEALNKRLFMKDFTVSIELTEALESRWTDQFVEIIADHM